MCLLAIFFRAFDDAPLVVGANREEMYARPGLPPQILDGPVRAVAGVDPQAGGTWFGVNARGVVAAVTNRPRVEVPTNARSRGCLTRDLLGCATAKEAADLAVRELATGRYADCNLFCADSDRAVVVESAEWLRVRLLPPGLHVLTNRDINDGSDPRVRYALQWLGQQDYPNAMSCLRMLQQLCGQTDGDHPPICLHGDNKGTVSSTLLLLRQAVGRSTYWHAQGPPDSTPYQDYSPLLATLSAVPFLPTR
jgi:uncharacterized protein with NRDE domain